MNIKTYQPSAKSIVREKHLIDAKGEILGRLASKVAYLLVGKHKATYAPHLDSGDFVTVTNAKEIRLTGKKPLQKVYRRHSGYPGGFKEISFQKMITTSPERVIELAVAGMLPDNKLKKRRLARLNVQAGALKQ